MAIKADDFDQERYFDSCLPIRKRVYVKRGEYTLYSYEDFFCGQWMGNLNIYKGEQMVCHATLDKAYTRKQLEAKADEWMQTHEDRVYRKDERTRRGGVLKPKGE